MNRYLVISRHLCCDRVYGESIEADNDEEAWQIVQDDLATNFSNDWLFTEDELRRLHDLCDKLLAGGSG